MGKIVGMEEMEIGNKMAWQKSQIPNHSNFQLEIFFQLLETFLWWREKWNSLEWMKNSQSNRNYIEIKSIAYYGKQNNQNRLEL